MSDGPRVTVDLEQLDGLLGVWGDKLPRALGVGMREGLLLMVRDVVANRLRGQYLRRRTGTGIRSVTASPRVAITGKR